MVTDCVNGHDVGMLETGGQPRLALEARHQLGIAHQLGGEQFDRNFALEGQVMGDKDDPHSAFANLTFQSPFFVEDLLDANRNKGSIGNAQQDGWIARSGLTAPAAKMASRIKRQPAIGARVRRTGFNGFQAV